MNSNPASYGGGDSQNQSGSNPNNYPPYSPNPYGPPPNPYGAPPPATPGSAPYDPYAVPPTVAANTPSSPPPNPPNPFPPYPQSTPVANPYGAPPSNLPGTNYGAPPPSQPGANPYGAPPLNAPNAYPSYPGNMPPPYNGAPPMGVPPTGSRPSGGKIVLIVLAVLVVLGGMLSIFAISAHNNQVAADNTHATATAGAHNTTATAQAQATTTALANATATAIVSTFPFSANLKLNDPLTDNSKGVGWRTDNNCKFATDGYHASETSANTYYTCPALQTSFNDFTYQVTVNMTQGDAAGITFRGNDANVKFYSFILASTGEYVLFAYSQSGVKPQTLSDATASNFKAHQANDLAVVARGNKITLYLNKQELTTITDSTSSGGQVGTIVYDLSASVEAVFTNAKVWQL